MDAEAWVAVGFVCFLGVAVYYGAHSRIGSALDARGRRIRAELDEAERLRKEAADLLASFEGKRARAEKEAADIVDQARAEAKLIADEAGERMTDFVKRRTVQAEAKIANAEAQAMLQVRSAAAEVAVATARIVLQGEATTRGSLADKLIDDGIKDVRRLTH